MSGRIRMVIIIVAIGILLSIASFILLARYYPPLNRSLFGEKFTIPFEDIQFWVKKVPQRNYYRVYAKYLKSPETESPDFGHGIFFIDKIHKGGAGGIVFNPKDGRIYGSGVEYVKYDDKGNAIDVEFSLKISSEELKKLTSLPTEWRFYQLGKGKIEGGLFKPMFLEGSTFAFRQLGSWEFPTPSVDSITIYFPNILKKLEKEELGKGSVREIVEDATRVKKY